MNGKKIFILSSSIICILTFILLLTWTISNWSTFVKTFNGTKLYTQSALDEAYEKGLGDKSSYDITISDYKKQIDKLQKDINEYNTQIDLLQKENQDYKSRIKDLESKLSEAEALITYYEDLLEAYKDSTKVIATFNYNGELYEVQVYAIDSLVEIKAPADTDYIQFNGWKVNNELVDLNTYQIVEDTTFEADLTYYQYVTLISQEEIITTQKVEKDSTINLASFEAPIIKYASHIGWTSEEIDSLSTRNDIVDNNVTIDEDVTYYAYYAVNVNGTFIDESNTYSLTIENNEITSCQLGNKTISRTSINEVAYRDSTNWYSVILTDSNNVKYEMTLYNYAQSFIVELFTGQGKVTDLIILKDTSYVVNSSTSVGNFKYYDYGTLTFTNGKMTVRTSIGAIGSCDEATYVVDNVYCYEQTNDWHYSVHYIAYIDCWLGCRTYGVGVDATAVVDKYDQLHIFARIQ